MADLQIKYLRGRGEQTKEAKSKNQVWEACFGESSSETPEPRVLYI